MKICSAFFFFILRSKFALPIPSAVAPGVFFGGYLYMPNPKRKILFHYYLESDRGLDCYFYLACVVPCHAAEEVCFPLECCKHCLKVYRLLVVIMSNVPNSLFYSHTQYQPVSQISCLDRFYILLPWQGQKGGGFSSPLCGVQRDP